MIKKSLLISVSLLAIAMFILAGCDKQAKSSTDTKCSLTGQTKTANANAPACKAPVKKECKDGKKSCPAMAEKKCSPEMAKKCAADQDAVKNCPMKDKKGCPMMKDKKPCCKKPCNVRDAKCKAPEPNAPPK